MKSYVLNFCGDGATVEILADNDREATRIAASRMADAWGEVFAADQWDADGRNDDDEPCKRLLFWRSEYDAENDDGSDAIASLSTVGAAR